MKQRLAYLALAIWIILWALFTVRPYFKKDLLGEYRLLARASAEEKHALITGKGLYELIELYTHSIPPPSTYWLIDIEPGSLEYRRAVYYLYPHIEWREAEFIIVSQTKAVAVPGYEPFKSLDAERYILRKTIR